MSNLHTKSPAKVNLHLKILKKLHDGYHELDTSFQLIDLYDEISFKKINKGISVNCNIKNINQSKNIVYKIASDLQKGRNSPGIEIKIKKNIPIGSGLGGGSSNAASTIIALNNIWNLNLNKTDIFEYGKSIGADIPFFLYGQNAYGYGIGDKLKYKRSITKKLLLIDPRIHNSSKKMFDIYDKKKIKEETKSYSYQNSFWEIYLSNEKIVKDFYDENINDFEISLSGSGSCMYVTYNERKEIDKLVKKIPSNWRFFFCKPLQYSPIRLL